jgi:hypothetical protein
MNAILKIGLRCSALLLPFVAYGQEDWEAPLGALPMQYNSSFAGETGSPRLSTVVGLQVHQNYTSGYRTYAAYDQFIPSIRSGVGLMIGYNYLRVGDEQSGRYAYKGNGAFFSLAVAPKFSMGGKVTLSPSLDVSLSPFRAHWSQAQVRNQSKGYRVGSRVGLLLNTEKFYVGYSVYLVNHFNTRVENDTTDFRGAGRGERFESYWQLGYTFGRGTESKFSFTPQLVFYTGTDRYTVRRYRLFSPVDFNLSLRYKKFICGVNATGVHIGWQTDKLRIIFSDNLQYTRRDDPGYAANIALRYIFKD